MSSDFIFTAAAADGGHWHRFRFREPDCHHGQRPPSANLGGSQGEEDGKTECESVDICGKCVNKIIKSELINERECAREKAG